MTAKLLNASLGTLLCGLAAAAPAAGPREELRKLTSQLQASPSDQALRERIIALAAKLKPPPALPEEAKRRMARGKAGFKTAEKPEDYKAASEEFRQAALAAPWWADAYFNLGQAQEKAGDLAGARTNLDLYLKLAPSAADADSVREKIYELEFMEEKKKAKASDLAGKWASESQRASGEYEFELHREGSEYRIRQVPTKVESDGITDRTPLLNVLGGGRIEVTLGQDIRWPGGHRATHINEYSLVLSEDGSRLSGTRRTKDVRGSRSEGSAVFYRVNF